MATNPTQIVIVRHAEKPAPPDINLSPRGRVRAAALAMFLQDSFGRPDFIFATKESEHSDRPLQTITPLAGSVGLPINAKHKDKEFGELANTLLTNPKYVGSAVVVCWHHGMIPELATALGATVPAKWKDGVFDRVWIITYDDAGVASFQDQPQQLLFGDSAT